MLKKGTSPPGLTRDYALLWIGQTVSSFGSGITGVALPLVGVLVLSATPAQMGVLGALDGLAVVVFGLLAGALVDRVRRRPLLIGSDLARAAALGLIPLAAAAGWLSMGLLYGVGAVVGVCTVLFSVARESYIPSLIPRKQLVKANSGLALSDSLAETTGPAAAGPLVQLLGAPVAIAVDAASFLASALGVGLIRKPEAPPRPAAERRTVRAGITEGLRALLADARLRALAFGGALFNFFGTFIGTLYVLYVVRDLHLTAVLVGFLVAAGGLSSVAGTLAAGRVIPAIGVGPAIGGGLALYGATSVLIVLAQGPVWLAAVFLFAAQLVGDAAVTLYLVSEISLRQSIIPNALLGRINAAMRLLTRGATPLAAIVAGVLGGVIGPRLTIAVGVAGVLTAGLWLLLSPVRKARIPVR
jgi:MFS family permease